MQTMTQASMGECLRACGADPGPGVDFLAFEDLDRSVRDDVTELRASPLVASGVAINGFVYDVRTGILTSVADPPSAAPDAPEPD